MMREAHKRRHSKSSAPSGPADSDESPKAAKRDGKPATERQIPAPHDPEASIDPTDNSRGRKRRLQDPLPLEEAPRRGDGRASFHQQPPPHQPSVLASENDAAIPTVHVNPMYVPRSGYYFQIVHVEGKKNVVADALSRKPQVSAMSISYHNELKEMKGQYVEDEDFARIYDQIINGQRHEHYILKSVFLMMHGKLCVIKQLRPKVFIECHALPYARHHGIDATLMQPLPIPEKPWESIAMDFIFDLPRTLTGNDGIWTIICRFSKQAHFVLVRKKIKSEHMVKLFMHSVFKYHGMPQSIISDRDPRMTSLFWKTLFENMGTTLKFSSSFHPQTDGQSEEANSTVLDLLKCYVLEHKATWEHYLPLVEYAYNNTVHTSTGKALFEIVEGGKKVPSILQTDI
ncbi:hypothetical protein L7F22_058732 [Adiantum nelumboides]|nr:hypothetical protein [Adiantum nelumboides]